MVHVRFCPSFAAADAFYRRRRKLSRNEDLVSRVARAPSLGAESFSRRHWVELSIPFLFNLLCSHSRSARPTTLALSFIRLLPASKANYSSRRSVQPATTALSHIGVSSIFTECCRKVARSSSSVGFNVSFFFTYPRLNFDEYQFILFIGRVVPNDFMYSPYQFSPVTVRISARWSVVRCSRAFILSRHPFGTNINSLSSRGLYTFHCHTFECINSFSYTYVPL